MASSSMLGVVGVDTTNVAIPIAVWNGADSVLQISHRDESKDHIAIFLILSHLFICKIDRKTEGIANVRSWYL